jgi:DNA-binding transcriptional ArsR family regulator
MPTKEKPEKVGKAGRGPRKAGRSRPMGGLEQVRALSHPLRLRLFELFAERPRTTKQAAEALGEAPTRLYHHVAALEKAGLVRLRETRRKRGTTEKYFEVVEERGGMAAPPAALAGKSYQRDLTAMAFVVFDQARNELVQALAAGTAQGPPPMLAVRGVLHLSPHAAKRLRKELKELLGRLTIDQQRAPGSRSRRQLGRYALTLALVPTGPVGES